MEWSSWAERHVSVHTSKEKKLNHCEDAITSHQPKQNPISHYYIILNNLFRYYSPAVHLSASLNKVKSELSVCW